MILWTGWTQLGTLIPALLARVTHIALVLEQHDWDWMV